MIFTRQVLGLNFLYSAFRHAGWTATSLACVLPHPWRVASHFRRRNRKVASTFDNEIIATDVDGGVGWTLAAVAIDSIVRIEHPGMHKSFEIRPGSLANGPYGAEAEMGKMQIRTSAIRVMAASRMLLSLDND
ncbi:hypothetical protein E5D57_002984 [Metarhizium anisopliae]|nr:hypothetical protein E5D57_002984 [Metarhizium anisopliae]